MMMPMSTSLPYIGSATENLTLSNPSCNNDSCKAFYDAHQLSQKLTSYAKQFDYGHYVTWFYLACIGCLTVVYLWRRWNQYLFHRGCSWMQMQPQPFPWCIKQRLVSVWRFFAYRRCSGWISSRFGLPSLGILAFMALAILYCLLLTFWQRPYYRNHRGYGSPPLAVRTGLMAVALTPLLFLLSGKANLVTMLTGIGHEKLNIFHRWVGWICFLLSVAHTIPFIVAPLKDGGYKALHKQFYTPGGLEYTGTPTLAILFGILVFSIPWFRHRAYEVFYHTHFWMAATYLGLMFWHCDNNGDSWDYLWASLAIWLATAAARAFWFNQTTSILAPRWLVGSSVTAKTYPDNMTSLQIVAPAGFHWRPGQHVFVRIPKLNLLDNHPFTIANADKLDGNDNDQQNLSLYIRSYAGFTRRLRHYLQSTPDAHLEAGLDGPYGGHHRDLSVEFDEIVLIAGGGGISAVLPWLDFVIAKYRHQRRMQVRSIRVYWSVKQTDSISWISDVLLRLRLYELMSFVRFEVHVTRNEAVLAEKEKEEPVLPQQKDNGETDQESIAEQYPTKDVDLGLDICTGRIDFASVCSSHDLAPGSRMVIIGCGPEGLKVDLSNAVAAAQMRVLRGEVAEIALWTETFGW
ncbi:hypothetical protein DV738_g1624, partial [Chaetothyriales sp. CBS 135597]